MARIARYEVDQYLKKMNKFNAFELEELKHMTCKEKLDAFFNLLENSYRMYSKEQIEAFHKEKISHLAHTQKTMCLLGGNK